MLVDVILALAVGLVLATAWVVGLWLLALARHDVSIIDAVFSLILLSIVGVGGVLLGAAPFSRKLLVFGLLTLWSVRITSYLGWRKWGEGEDPRYTKLRSWKAPGREFNFFALRQIFVLQGATMFALSLPLIITLTPDTPSSLGVLAVVGTLVWLVGFGFEAIGDLQLTRFRNDASNAGRVLDTGLWRYTAHPNYFGEVAMAWGLFIICLEVPWAVLGIVGPIVYTRLVLRTTGTPTLEKHLRRTKPGYADYLERTSSFWPRPPRNIG